MKQATMVCAGAVLLAIAGVSYKLRHTPVAPEYAFELPTMFFQCIEFPVPEDGTFIPSWKFEQAVHMNFIDFKGVVLMPGNYNFGGGCGYQASATLARGTAKSITFGKGGEVTIEDYKPDARSPHPTDGGFTNIKRVDAPTHWHFVTENSAGSGTLLSGDGDQHHSLNECRGSFIRYREMNKENWPGSLKLAYCVYVRNGERTTMWP